MTTVALQKWGNSQGFRLPKQFLSALGWKTDEELSLLIQDGRLVIEPVRSKRRKTFKELFANYCGEYQPEEMEWGQPAGKEPW